MIAITMFVMPSYNHYTLILHNHKVIMDLWYLQTFMCITNHDMMHVSCQNSFVLRPPTRILDDHGDAEVEIDRASDQIGSPPMREITLSCKMSNIGVLTIMYWQRSMCGVGFVAGTLCYLCPAPSTSPLTFYLHLIIHLIHLKKYHIVCFTSKENWNMTYNFTYLN
jgi:hypothetical protein